MKTVLTLAAIAAAFAGVSAASAHDMTTGHWEWRTTPSFGPKTTGPGRVRVWVEGADTSMANCSCAMMKADARGCMTDMRSKAGTPSAG